MSTYTNARRDNASLRLPIVTANETSRTNTLIQYGPHSAQWSGLGANDCIASVAVRVRSLLRTYCSVIGMFLLTAKSIRANLCNVWPCRLTLIDNIMTANINRPRQTKSPISSFDSLNCCSLSNRSSNAASEGEWYTTELFLRLSANLPKSYPASLSRANIPLVLSANKGQSIAGWSSSFEGANRSRPEIETFVIS